MNLTDATTAVLNTQDPAAELRLVDDYIAAWRKRGDRFILPREHAHLAPIVERYADQPSALLKYVRAVRDEVAMSRGMATMEYKHLQELVRTLDVRYVQVARRDRLRAAVEWLSREQPELTTEHKKVWVRRVEQRWAKQRLAWLTAERKKAGGRLSEDLRRAALDAFWDNIDEQIAVGALPRYE